MLAAIAKVGNTENARREGSIFILMRNVWDTLIRGGWRGMRAGAEEEEEEEEEEEGKEGKEAEEKCKLQS